MVEWIIFWVYAQERYSWIFREINSNIPSFPILMNLKAHSTSVDHHSLSLKMVAQFSTLNIGEDFTRRGPQMTMGWLRYSPRTLCSDTWASVIFAYLRLPQSPGLWPQQNLGHMCSGGLGTRLTEPVDLPILLPCHSEMGGEGQLSHFGKWQHHFLIITFGGTDGRACGGIVGFF